MKLRCLLTFGAVASLESFLRERFSDRPLWVVFRANVPERLSAIDRPKVLYDVSKPLEEFSSRYVRAKVNYLIYFRNLRDLRSIVDVLLSNLNYDTKQKHLLVTDEATTPRTVRLYFKLLFRADVYDVVLFSDSTARTWYPYDERSECGSKVILKRNLSDPFANKIPRNLNGCRVKLMWQHHLLMTKGPSDDPPGVVNSMFEMIARKTGLLLDYEPQPDPLVYSEHFRRVPASNLSARVAACQIDVIANCYGPSVRLFVDASLETSVAIVMLEDLWLLPRKRHLPMVYAFFSALTPVQYLLVAVTVAAFVATWYLTDSSPERSVGASFFDVVRVCLQQPTIGDGGGARRVLLVFAFFFAVHVGYAYGSQLMRVLYRPVYPDSLRSLEEVLDKTDLEFRYPSYAGAIQRSKDEGIWRRTEARKTKEDALLYDLGFEERRETFVKLDGVLEVNSLDLYYVRNVQDLEILAEKLATSPLFLLMRRRFPLFDAVNLAVLRLQEAGIVEQLLRNAVRSSVKFEVPEKVETDTRKRLSVEDVEMIGLLLLAGNSSAAVAFFVELAIRRMRIRKLRRLFVN